MKQPGNLFRKAIAVVLAAVGVMAVTASTASAEVTCSVTTRYDMCFWIRPAGDDQFNVHVGFHYKVSRADAQAIIDQPGDPLDAWAMAGNVARFKVPVIVFTADDNLGLTADFDRNVPRAALADQMRARVRVFDNRTAEVETFFSNTLTAPYDPD